MDGLEAISQLRDIGRGFTELRRSCPTTRMTGAIVDKQLLYSLGGVPLDPVNSEHDLRTLGELFSQAGAVMRQANINYSFDELDMKLVTDDQRFAIAILWENRLDIQQKPTPIYSFELPSICGAAQAAVTVMVRRGLESISTTTAKNDPPESCFGITLDEEKRTIHRKGYTTRIEKLGSTRWSVFKELLKASQRGGWCRKVTIKDVLQNDLSENAAEAAISELRRQLEPLGLIIKNKRQVGYQLGEKTKTKKS